MQQSPSSTLKFFLFSLMLCLGGGWLTGLLTQNGVHHWYPHLIKPAGTPPNFVFPLVWTLIYIMMAIALTLLWNAQSKQKRGAFSFFAIQLCLNFSWSTLFFHFQLPFVALLDLTILWIFITLTILSFWKHTRLGSILLIPYLVWTTYAFYLNLFIWRLN